MLDPNTNGRVNRVTITWSESLAATTTNRTIWTLANVPSGGTLSSVSVGHHRHAHDHRGCRRAPTPASGRSRSRLAPAANGPATLPAPVDLRRSRPHRRRPPVAGVCVRHQRRDRRCAQPGDTLSVLFSEPMDTSSIPATTTVTLTDPAGAGSRHDHDRRAHQRRTQHRREQLREHQQLDVTRSPARRCRSPTAIARSWSPWALRVRDVLGDRHTDHRRQLLVPSGDDAHRRRRQPGDDHDPDHLIRLF
ncbi:MAG: Ig-like domain-containing protein [Ilumatobacteraceae bacterium]